MFGKVFEQGNEEAGAPRIITFDAYAVLHRDPASN
jgi:hypothetical protein